MIKNNKNIFKAFTIIELLVSVSIIVVLSTLFLTNYKTSSDESDLSNSHTSLFNDLESVKWRAINLEQYNGALPDYWGVHLEKASTSYQIFADFGTGDETLRIKNFDSNSFISNISLSDRTLVLFSTETGFPIFYDLLSSSFSENELSIEIKNDNFNFGKIITVNSFGLVDYADCFCSVGYINKCSWCE